MKREANSTLLLLLDFAVAQSVLDASWKHIQYDLCSKSINHVSDMMQGEGGK